LDYTHPTYKTALSLLSMDGAEEKPELLEYCAAAEAELKSRLHEGVSPEDIGNIWNTACALAAISMYRLTPGELRFRAGNLSIGERHPVPALRARAEALLAPYLKDDGFAFLGVRG
jgi:hypothetical protein